MLNHQAILCPESSSSQRPTRTLEVWVCLATLRKSYFRFTSNVPFHIIIFFHNPHQPGVIHTNDDRVKEQCHPSEARSWPESEPEPKPYQAVTRGENVPLPREEGALAAP